MHISIIFILQIVWQVTANDFLEFVPVDNANTDENIYLKDNDPTVVIDAMSKTARNIYFLGTNALTKHTVTFACLAGKRTIPLSEVQFCCRPDAIKSPHCNRLFSKPTRGTITCENLTFSYIYNKETGANFTMSFHPAKEHKFAYNGLVSCSVSDSDARIESNEIEFRDAIFYVNQLGVVGDNHVKVFKSPISPSDFPLAFQCGSYSEKMMNWPSWMAAVWNILTPYEWAFCNVGTGTTPVGCAKTRQKFSIGDSETTMDGTLFVLNDRVFAENPNSALICVTGSTTDPILTYASMFADPKILKGFTIDKAASPDPITALRAESPTNINYQFNDGTILENFCLWAFYRAPIETPTYPTWFKDGIRLTSNDAKPYSFCLPSKVERRLAGRYALTVSSPGYDDLNFVYNIDVVGPPKFLKVDCIEDLYYVMEGRDQEIICSVGAGKSNIKVSINGFESDTPHGLKATLAGSLELANRPIAELDINFDVQGDDENGRQVTVTVKNLKKDQNFRLSIKASNENGQSQIAGTVRVVPKPVLSTSPKDMSCIENCDEAPYEVQCIADKSIELQWTMLNIANLQDWLISRTWPIEALMSDPDLSTYFRYDPANPSHIEISPMEPFMPLITSEESLTSTEPSTIPPTTASASSLNSPVISSTTGKVMTLEEMINSKMSKPVDLLQIECRYRLFVNNPRAVFDPVHVDGSETIRRRRAGIVLEHNKIYDSYYEKDKSISEQLIAVRSFSEYVEPTMANFAWITAVVISVLFLIAVIAVGVWLCTRDRGETYKLYRKECEHRIDPLLELKEKETFQAYERPEEPPTMASRHSLDGSLDVGSDDDGELDGYNMDPGNFNEEASYIGAYTAVPGTMYSNGRPRSDHHTAV